MPETITSLIEKLEGAGGPSLVLDGEIWCAVNGYTFVMWDGAGCVYRRATDGGISHEQASRIRPFSASLDAALALAERVLPGWWWTAGRCGLTCHASVGPDSKFIGEPDLSKFDSGFHADVPNPSTPAIALCIAILRAQSEARV
jgi:hypothetical protein